MNDVADHRFNTHDDVCVRCGEPRIALVRRGWPLCPGWRAKDKIAPWRVERRAEDESATSH